MSVERRWPVCIRCGQRGICQPNQFISNFVFSVITVNHGRTYMGRRGHLFRRRSIMLTRTPRKLGNPARCRQQRQTPLWTRIEQFLLVEGFALVM